MAIPDCECIWGLPLNEKLDAIYCVYYQNAQSTVDLPTCECVKGMPLQDKVSAIFCALLQQGGGGGNIDPDQINGITPFGISAITGNPNPLELLTTDGAGLLDSSPGINFGQITDASDYLIATQSASSPGPMSLVIPQTFWDAGENASISFLTPVQTAEFIAGGPVFSGSVSPLESGSATNGMVTNFSS